MGLPLKKQVLASCRHLLRPLVRILLRQGMAYGEFAEIVKSVYVEVAREDFTPEGKRPTDSRVAILTGLTRKDVKRLREEQEAELSGANNRVAANDAHRATRVLSGWHQDPDFCDDLGRPLALPDDGAEISFSALVKRYSGDMPSRAMLDELERVGAVIRDDNNLLIAKTRSYIPNHDDPQSIRMLGTATHDLMATIDHNLNESSEDHRYMQRVVSNDRVNPKAIPLFRRIVSERGQDFLEWLDDWLTSHEVELSDIEDDKTESNRVGMGIYFFQDDPDAKDKKSDTD